VPLTRDTIVQWLLAGEVVDPRFLPFTETAINASSR
jgi:hypothetical protein